METIPIQVTVLLVGGLYVPFATLYIALSVLVCRTIYIVTYVSGGPNKRLIGAIGERLPMYGLTAYLFGSMAYRYVTTGAL